MAEKNDKKLTPFQSEMIATAKKVIEYKIGAEANVVSIIYKHPDELYNTNLTLDDFSNNIWKVYFQIAYDNVIVEKKEILDDITIGLYLEKHSKLKQKYDEYGGYKTIETAMAYVNVENFNGYVTELRKWKAVIKLCKVGFPVKDRLSDFVDMSAEAIYNEYEAFLNDTFANIDSDVKSYDICYGIDELIQELNDGIAVGLPYYDMPILTNETGGQYLGSITLLGGLSNVGKSSLARTTTIPSIIANGEKIVIMLNEDSLKKWQRELLVWVANNIYKKDLQKHTVRNGGYSEEVLDILNKSKEWLKAQTDNHTITIIPFQQYKTANAIKVIRKYASMGVKYFMLDTFKMDSGNVSDKSWLQMQQNMVDINDVIKQEALNVHILITFQLAKGSAVQRYYTQENIGMAKNIVDVASTCIMVRNVFDDEYTDEKRALSVYRLEGKNGKTKIPVKLDKSKRYQILFITKNREGSANAYQLVIENDLSRNVMQEIGITNVPIDF